MVSDVLDLPLTARNALQQKLTQMVLQNGMANQDGDFVLTASLSVLEKEYLRFKRSAVFLLGAGIPFASATLVLSS